MSYYSLRHQVMGTFVYLGAVFSLIFAITPLINSLPEVLHVFFLAIVRNIRDISVLIYLPSGYTLLVMLSLTRLIFHSKVIQLPILRTCSYCLLIVMTTQWLSLRLNLYHHRCHNRLQLLHVSYAPTRLLLLLLLQPQHKLPSLHLRQHYHLLCLRKVLVIR